MRLGQKNLCYSMALAGVMLLFLTGYFMYMLPSLYVDYVMEQNLNSLREQHRSYMENHTYEGIRVKNATACISVDIPMEGNSFLVTGKAFSMNVTVRDRRLQEILDRFRQQASAGQVRREDAAVLEEDAEKLMEMFRETMRENTALPFSISQLYVRDMGNEFYHESVKMHSYLDDFVIFEMSIEDSNNRYTNYIAVECDENRLVFSLLPAVAPEADEIRPVVLQSLPMLAAVILLVVLLSSQMYSRGIVGPVIELVAHAEQMKSGHDFVGRRIPENRQGKKDEVRMLADTLDDLYRQIRKGYQKLEEKNQELEEENKRQEVFLRASSHQLKTPIAAALLLVDGMINEIGKYRDTKEYLPRVKEQLLSMRKMVEEILYLNRCTENIRIHPEDIGRLLEQSLQSYQVELADRRLSLDVTENGKLTMDTDEAVMVQILDNLLSNAVKYTPDGGRIQITVEGEDKEIRIENFGVRIPGELLDHIFEPFVGGNHGAGSVPGKDSHGLGLYIASYYAKKLGISLTVSNGRDSVRAVLAFPEKK